VALVVAVLPNLPGFINAATGTVGTDAAWFHPFFDSIYGYAWFVGLPLAMIVYLVCMQIRPFGRTGSIT